MMYHPLGVSETRGLPCRFGKCQERFHSAGNCLVDAAVQARNAHEYVVHGYVHVPLEPGKSWDFTQAFSKRGRSTLGRKKK